MSTNIDDTSKVESRGKPTKIYKKQRKRNIDDHQQKQTKITRQQKSMRSLRKSIAHQNEQENQ